MSLRVFSLRPEGILRHWYRNGLCFQPPGSFNLHDIGRPKEIAVYKAGLFLRNFDADDLSIHQVGEANVALWIAGSSSHPA
jgi:hypothetical protein